MIVSDRVLLRLSVIMFSLVVLVIKVFLDFSATGSSLWLELIRSSLGLSLIVFSLGF